MTQFEKRPERAEALQFSGGVENAAAVLMWLQSNAISAYHYPEGARSGVDPMDGTLVTEPVPEHLELFNTQGQSGTVQIDDWIIADGNEIFRIMSDEEFDAQYAAV